MSLFIKKLFKERLILLSLLYLCLIATGITYSDDLIFQPHTSTYSWSDDLITLQSTNSSAAGNKNIIIARYLKNPEASHTI